MSRVYSVTGLSVSSYKKEGEKAFSLSKGDIFDAVLTHKDNHKLTFKTEEGLSFSAKARGLPINLNDKVKFQAVAGEKGQISLKILENMTQKAFSPKGAMLSNGDVMELFKQSNFTHEENIFEIKSPAEYEASEEEALALKRIKSKLAYMEGNLSSAVINELMAAGVPIGDMTLGMMNTALKTISENSEAIERADLINSPATYSLEINDPHQMNGRQEDIAKELAKQKLPVTEDNIAFVEKAADLFGQIKDISPQTAAELVKGGFTEDLKGIYQKKYSSRETIPISDEKWEAIEKSVKDIFEEEGIVFSTENKLKARIFVANEIKISKENIEKFDFYRNLKDEPIENIIKNACKAIKEGKEAYQTAPAADLKKEALAVVYEEISGWLPKIDENIVYTAEKNNIPLTLYNLREIAVTGNAISGEASFSNKIMLMQIQLKLTKEVSHGLIQKGINIDTMPLEKAIAALKAEERALYKNILAENGENPSPDNVNKLEDIFNAVSNTKILTSNVYSDIILKKTPFTIKGVENSIAYARFMADMENFMTVPSLKWGDSFEKVKSQFAGLLQSLDISDTLENVRAAQILSRADIEVNNENILNVKLIDSKLQEIQNKLHPEIGVKMIKDGINPLDMHVDEVLAYINSYEKDLGKDFSGKIAEFIYEMDKNEALDADKREALIGIYRAMNQIERNGAAAIGVNMAREANPTLKNLLDASDYYKETKGNRNYSDIKIKDGHRENKTVLNSIRNAIETGVSAAADHRDSAKKISKRGADYFNMLSQSISNLMTPRNFARLAENPNYMDMDLTEVLNELQGYKDTKEVYDPEQADAVYSQIKKSISEGPDFIRDMEHMGIALTFNNIQAFKELKEKPAQISEKIEELKEKYADAENIVPETGPEENTLAKIHENINDILLKGSELPNEYIKELLYIQKAVRVQSQAFRRTNEYNIPVKVKDKVCNLNILIPKGTIDRNKTTIALTLQGKQESFKLFAEAEGNGLDIHMPEMMLTEDEKSMFETFLSPSGFYIKSLNGEELKGINTTEIRQGMKITKEKLFELGKAAVKFADLKEHTL